MQIKIDMYLFWINMRLQNSELSPAERKILENQRISEIKKILSFIKKETPLGYKRFYDVILKSLAWVPDNLAERANKLLNEMVW
ncbi:MAG: hypothetical protein ACTSVL_13225 [Promethearchaeota archaeon]